MGSQNPDILPMVLQIGSQRCKHVRFPARTLNCVLVAAMVCQLIWITRILPSTSPPEHVPLDYLSHQHLPPCHDILPALTRELRYDPISKGLQPIRMRTPTGNGTTITTVPGFDWAAFRGHRIAFLGDSTLFYLTKFFYTVFHRSKTREIYIPSSNVIHNLTTATQTVLNHAGNRCHQYPNEPCIQPLGHEVPIPVEDTVSGMYHMQWSGMSGILDNWHTEKFLHAMWEKTHNSIRPDVMVVNMGLHWLHLYGIQRDTGPEAILRWIHYEKWLEEVYDHAHHLGVQVLLYKTTNFVCDKKMTGKYAEAVRLYNSFDKETLQHCSSRVAQEFAKINQTEFVTEKQISDYCVNGTLNNRGSNLLNSRLHRYVKHKERNDGKMYVGVFNDNQIQQCEHTAVGDGLHYHTLNLLRIRLLGNYLQCARNS